MGRAVLVLLAAGAAAVPSALARPGVPQSRADAPATMPAGFVRAAERQLTARFPHNQPGAVALVVKNGKTVFRRAYGLADLEFSVMLEPDMVFRLGAITEQFTAAAVLQLAERGKLGLDDAVSRHLEAVPDAWKGITVRHLLTHTAGVPEPSARAAGHAAAPSGPAGARLIGWLAGPPLAFEPGTRVAHARAAYWLLGAVIERASGQSYADYMRQHVFVPLGMRQTICDDRRRVVPRRARGYARIEAEWVNADAPIAPQPDAASGVASTVDDLAQWNAALDRERILSAASLELMLRPHPATGHDAIGWRIDTHDGHPVAEHSSNANGFAAHVLRLSDDGLFVAVLSNSEAADASNAARRLAALALGRPIVDPREVALAEATLEAYAGRYEGNGGRFDVRRDGARLRVIWEDRPPTVLAASAPGTFFEPDGVLRVAFGEDAAGAVDRVTLSGWGTERVAKRAD
jgi:CubicO group peptidase (beta-lactamase class C family)